MPSLGSGDATAVDRTTVSPVVTSAAPEACLAMRPVSKTNRLPPASSTATSCFVDIVSSFHFFRLGNLCGECATHTAGLDRRDANRLVRTRARVWVFEVLKGHDFSRAANRPKQTRALAPEGIPLVPRRHLCASSGVPCGSPGTPWSGVPGLGWTVTSVRSECFRFNVCFRRLLADSEFADHVAVAVRVVRFEVIQQAAALACSINNPRRDA